MSSSPSAAAIPPSVIGHRPFTLFWCARTATALAFQMFGVAVGWQVYALTGSPLYLGLVVKVAIL
ncbi:hypothetical protein [Geobacter pickeringii]|uniref:MFS transporter n=1 Tax=Geobacter pickeringii TaxID=345632 RepID=A0A0B5BCE7_9BACT|nr:hypothetical protein [Geobacter pickeringii]AJE02250.1 hypothetical protein GPICK_01645 [Geobacter pickeringii]